MIIDFNLLKRLGKRFGVFPISKGPPPLQAALQKPEIVFIKAPAGVEPAITGGGYQWDDELNGYRLGTNQKLFLAPDGTTIWTFKDVLFRGLSLDSVQKWTSGDAEYPMGKANAFFIVYGKLTGQELGEGETAGDNVPDGETEPGDGGGLATADDDNAPPFSKQDIQAMLKGEFPADAPSGPKASMDTAIPSEPSAPVGPPPDRSKVGQPLPPEMGSEAEKIIKTLYKKAKVNPGSKLSKQNPIRLDSDEIIDLYQRAKKMAPEEGEKLIAFLKSGAVLPLEEGHIAKHQLQSLMEVIVGGIVGEVEKAKKKAKAKKAAAKPEPEEPSHSQMDWEPSGEIRPQMQRGDKHEQWLVDLANKMWKDPEDIGHSGQGWRVKRVVPHGEGTTAYLLTLTKQYHKSRIFINRNGRWFWRDPINRHQGWEEVEGPVNEPTLDEMTTTSGGGGSSAGTPGYNIPGAFGRKMQNRKGHIEVLGYKMTPQGEKEYNKPADKLYEAIKLSVKQMMREGIVQKPEGGKCPHCGKDVWSKEAMVCSSCKKHLPPKPKVPKPLDTGPLQQEASGLGADFDRAQRAYDNQMPPEDPPEVECPECGGAGHYTQQWKKGRYYQWGAECDQCGNTWGDDNLDDERGDM